MDFLTLAVLLAVALVGGAVFYLRKTNQTSRAIALLQAARADPAHAADIIEAGIVELIKGPAPAPTSTVSAPAPVVPPLVAATPPLVLTPSVPAPPPIPVPLPVPPVPALPSVYADVYDLARDCGVRGVTQAVTLDGKTIFSGTSPALAFYTVPGGVSSTAPAKAA
jgi:hypothetical protein